MLDQDILDGRFLVFRKIDDAAFEFADLFAFNAGLVCDIPRRNADE